MFALKNLPKYAREVSKLGSFVPERDATRVARWFVFNPKIPIGVNFRGP
jgi:hypothetical protein